MPKVIQPHPTDPDPKLFKILRIEQHGAYVIALINYPNCTNYGGDKVIVWHDRTVEEIKAMPLIDPHFLERDPTLVARFVPTILGWWMAEVFVSAVTLDKDSKGS